MKFSGPGLAVAFIPVICLALLEQLCSQEWNLPLLIGSFGASAVLAFGAPLARWPSPATWWAGMCSPALVGVTCQLLLSGNPVLAAGLAVSTAIALMHATQTLHPPGSANGPHRRDRRPRHPQPRLLVCAAALRRGTICMLALALAANNLGARKRYPLFWWWAPAAALRLAKFVGKSAWEYFSQAQR